MSIEALVHDGVNVRRTFCASASLRASMFRNSPTRFNTGALRGHETYITISNASVGK